MSGSYVNRLAQISQNLFHRVHVRSALNPMLLLSFISFATCLPAAYLFRDYDFLRNFFSVIAVLPSIVTCGIAVGFAIYKADKLQSEEYQLRQHSLHIIQQQKGRIPIDATTLVAIANPEVRQLEAGSEEQS